MCVHESDNSYEQLIKSVWAVTIHKAQGKTFSTVYIDLASGTFAHGQLYV
ncbi:MAG: ATP-binding domain-containing protein, partial [Candidatus Doudnabacteria bacterium]|nr:ATP-binding domain-containing protein [Candidatus Doudnabacteria bacterium]